MVIKEWIVDVVPIFTFVGAVLFVTIVGNVLAVVSEWRKIAAERRE